MKPAYVAGLAVLSCAAFAAPLEPAPATGQSAVEAPVLASTPALVAGARLVQGVLEDPRYAYRIASKASAAPDALFDSYLTKLDPNRFVFDQQDVEALAPQGRRLAEAAKAGDLAPVLAIFSRYRDEVAARTAAARRALAEPGALDAGKGSWAPARSRVPRAANDAALDELWRQRIANDALELRLAGRQPAEIRELLASVYARQAERVAAMTAGDALALFLDSYARSIDDGNEYYPPDDKSLEGGLFQVGIGMSLQQDGVFARVYELVPGGPSAATGQIHPGDRVLAIGEGDAPLRDVVGQPLEDVVGKLRGEEGSALRLQLLPAQGPARTVRLARTQVMELAHASVVQVGGQRIGVIRPESFYQDFEARSRNKPDYRSVTRDVVRLLDGFRKDGVAGIVLDLRDNQGGSLTEVIDMAAAFVGGEPALQIRESGGRLSVESGEGPVAWAGPLAVLVNARTASGAEMLAAALQDHGRGLVVGTRTFRRGTIQSLFDLGRGPQKKGVRFGRLKITIAEMFRVDGRSLHGFGVTPDVAFLPDIAPEGKPRRVPALPVDARGPAPDPARLQAAHEARVRADPAFQAWHRHELAVRERNAANALSFDEATRRAQRSAPPGDSDAALLRAAAAILVDAAAQTGPRDAGTP